MELGKLGVWTFSDDLDHESAAKFVQRVEKLGYGAIWIPDALGFDPFVRAAFLLERCDRLILATGIANIYARDPMAMKAAQTALFVQFQGRFLLGLGVSHAPFVEGVRGHAYRRPVATMRGYLDAMEKAPYSGPDPLEEPPIVLGALRTRMLGLAAERTRGAHPYLTTPEHTRRAREIMGPEAWLCPEVKVLLESDPEKARRLGREACSGNLAFPNYQKNLDWLGYTSADLEAGGSDRLIDDLVVWGDEAALHAGVKAHLDAGASHVCVHTVNPDGSRVPHLPTLEALAPSASA